jgi:hypothetical protein
MSQCPYITPTPDSICAKYMPNDSESQPGFCSAKYSFLCTEDLSNKLPRLSFSSIKNFLRCQEYYWLRNIKGVERKPYFLNEALKAGTIWGMYLAFKHGYKHELCKNDLIEKYQPSDVTLAKLNALMRSYCELGIVKNSDCICEKEFFIPFHNWQLYGFIDRAYDDHIVESKLTTRPDNYLSIPQIELQAGTYLYSDPHYEYVIMEITRMPELRQKKDEGIAEYQDRIYSDIIRRPSYYFIGWDMKKRTFGKKFYRSEFDLKELPMIYHKIAKQLRYCIDENLWVKNELACTCPFICDYWDVRKTGVISEEMYEIRSFNKANDNTKPKEVS